MARFDASSALLLAWDKKTSQFTDRSGDVLTVDEDGTKVKVRFRDSRYPFSYNPENIIIAAPVSAVEVGDALVEVDGVPWPAAKRLEYFDTRAGWWTRVHYPTQAGDAFRTYPSASVRVAANARVQPRVNALMTYFDQVVAAHPSDDPLHHAFKALSFVHPDSALSTYLSGSLCPPAADAPTLVFPFSSNDSQRAAIDTALRHQISVIEGPPGTGKTQTILNLIANIVRNPDATLGVVSFNNAAVDNVFDKLSAAGFGFIAAPMGSRERQEMFLLSQGARNAALGAFKASTSPHDYSAPQLAYLTHRIGSVYRHETYTAELRRILDGLGAEAARFDATYPNRWPDLLPGSAASWPSKKIMALLAEIDLADARSGAFAQWRWSWRRRRTYRLSADVDVRDPRLNIELQRLYLWRRALEVRALLDASEAYLATPDIASVRAGIQAASREAFVGALAQRYKESTPVEYSAQDLWRSRDRFARDYPVLLSTCHSLPSNVGTGRLLDYLIIDEASQVNLAIAVLAMSVARNVIVVGDVHQLPHIATDIGGVGVDSSLSAYDYTRHSVISSLIEVFGEGLPRTLLREHYRCDPRIIEFCNRSFYGGRLLPMRAQGGGEALAVVRTAPGHHARAHVQGGQTNERERDVVVTEAMPTFASDVRPADVGVVSPFRKQAELIGASLPGVEADTVHKFQGREKSVVILSTVIDATQSDTPLPAFVDDPRMINVAVSRAQDRLVVVANPDLPEQCTHLRDLISYIEHQSPSQSVRSDIVSVFDVLYSDYATALTGLARKMRGRTPFASEEAVMVVIERLLTEERFRRLQMNYQVFLYNLMPTSLTLTDAEAAFVRHRSSVDFVISDRVTGAVLGAIEVDGFSYHQDDARQRQRDALKDSILAKAGVPLLRLPTTGSGEVSKLEAFLGQLAPASAA